MNRHPIEHALALAWIAGAAFLVFLIWIHETAAPVACDSRLLRGDRCVALAGLCIDKPDRSVVCARVDPAAGLVSGPEGQACSYWPMTRSGMDRRTADTKGH